MRYLFLFSLMILSCATNQKSTIANGIKVNTETCPEDGICALELFPDQTLTIEKDGIGALYPKITEGNKTIIKFEFKRNEILNTVDGQYSELIYLEIDSNNLEVDLKDEALKKSKALFARLCFCRGQTGYYPIKVGQLSIKKQSDNLYHLKMNFKIDEVPQVISVIDEIFEVK